MTFDKVNRRVHLYGALILLPWLLMYGLSSYYIAHPPGPPKWSVQLERDYALAPIQPDADLDAIGDGIMRDLGMTGRHGAYRHPKGQLEIYAPRFTGPTRVTYFPEKHRLLVERQEFRVAGLLTGMHTRGGFERGTWLDWMWAVLVDLASLGVIVWVASGIYMWWNLRRLRFWGMVALGGGVASFMVFLLAL